MATSLPTHFGDPCIHCGTPHDEVAPGACPGDESKAVPIAYCGLGVRWDNVEHLRVRMSTGRITDIWEHISISSWFPATWLKDVRYDESLRKDHERNQ